MPVIPPPRRWTMAALLLSVPLAATLPAQQPARPPVEPGDWIGVLSQGGQHRFLSLRLAGDARLPLGSATVPGECRLELPITRAREAAGSLTLSVATLGTLHGRMTKHELSGRSTGSAGVGTFTLRPVTPIHPSALEGWVGTYRLPNDSVVAITPLGVPVTQIRMRIGDELQTLYPTADTVFVASPSGSEVVFNGGGRGAPTVRVRPAGGSALVGTRVELYRVEPVTYTSDGVRIAGALLLPTDGAARRPAIVMVHGSGPVDRTRVWVYAEDLARRGIATLITDKPGTGESGGDWLSLSFQDRANDALAGVEYLRGRQDVDPDRVGLWGISQGGWVIPMAAAQSRHVAFIIPVSAAGVSPAEQELYRIGWQLRAEGRSETDIQLLVDGWKLAYGTMRTGQGAAQLDSAVRALRKRLGRSFYGLPPESAQIGINQVMVNLGLDHDPVPPLRKVRVPVLAIWGAIDKYVPVEVGTEVFRSALAEAGNADVTIKVFPNSTHNITLGETGVSGACLPRSVFAPGYLRTVHDWVRRVTAPSPARGSD